MQDQYKKRFHKARNLKRSTSSNESLREARRHGIETVHAEYVAYSQKLIRKAEITLNLLKALIPGDSRLKELERWIKGADYQCQLIIRRVLNHETIPHSEKVFSLFERHTEWISKGKAGVPVELGLRVCVLQDQFGFTLHHLVMEKQTDDQVTVAIAKGAKQRFPEVSQVSYDRGFWSKENLEKLELPFTTPTDICLKSVVKEMNRYSGTSKCLQINARLRTSTTLVWLPLCIGS